MNINQYDKDAFVKAVMEDVPMIDYEAQAQKIALDFVIAMLPPEVLAVYKKYPACLENSSVHLPNPLDNIQAPLFESSYRVLEKSDIWPELNRLAELQDKQDDARSELKSKLRGIIGSCRTLKQAKERLPEFEKYLPADREGSTANLPVANLVSDLMKAGWPKGASK